MKSENLGIPILSSVAIHIFIILIGSNFFHGKPLRQRDFLPIDLVDLPRPQFPESPKRIAAPPEVKKPAPTPSPRIEKRKETKPVAKKEVPPAPQVEVAKPEAPVLPVPLKEEPAKLTEAKPSPSAQIEVPASFPSGSRVEGGGSEASAGSLFGRGDVGVVPGSGTAGGGGGTASSGLGRGSDAPGLRAEKAPIKTHRHAKPIQTARATYPPIALRAGLESDVTLQIEIDTAGKVTKAEIVKSGGAGFDEEALKAVKQSRFEPAHRNGQNVPAEFTYIYRFRLAK